ncbi:MAG: hypothetical protein JW704_07225 [Anaerolineaceae bacterium]|nr:hypothetical protein [Anaerolineaceae bacterium]MBN2678175.1 hypothetical protein [Anaerolineaceae bacterium]
MPKTFITERDIEDMARRGIMELAVDDNIVLTDLAYEKAGRLGVNLLQQNGQPPAAPIRPYLSQPAEKPHQSEGVWANVRPSTEQSRGSSMVSVIDEPGELKKRVIDAVNSKLEGKVDPAMLKTIVERVLSDLGVH